MVALPKQSVQRSPAKVFHWPWANRTTAVKQPIREDTPAQSAIFGGTQTSPRSGVELRTLAQHPVVANALLFNIGRATGLNWDILIDPDLATAFPGVEASLPVGRALFKRPSRYFPTFPEFFARELIDYYVHGWSPLDVESGKSETPIGLWPVPPDELAIVGISNYNNPEEPGYYQWSGIGFGQQVKRGSIVAVKRGANYKLTGDYSLRLLQQTLTALDELDGYNAKDYKGHGRFPETIANFPGANEQDLVKVRDDFKKYVTEGGEVLATGFDEHPMINSLRKSNKEQEMLGYRLSLQREVWAFLGVNPSAMGDTDGINRAIAAVGRQQSNEGTFKGDMCNFEGFYTQILQRIHPALYFDFTDLDTFDPLGMADLYLRYMEFMTINEVRALKQLPPIPGGDIIMSVARRGEGGTPNGMTPGAPEAATPSEVLGR